MPHNLIIIQARLSSTRLPGKVLKPIWNDRALLDLQVSKIKALNLPFVLATTTSSADDVLVDWAAQNQVNVFRGDEQNVLKRFIDCAKKFDAQNLIRVCSDNPFIQIDQIPYYLKFLESGVDYISYCHESGTPAIKTHWGLFVEGVSIQALERSAALIEKDLKQDFYSEHVTNFIYGNSELFKVQLDKAPKAVFKRDNLRFTVDTPDDFDNMKYLLELIDHTTDYKGLDDLISIVDKHPKIKEMMQRGITSFNK